MFIDISFMLLPSEVISSVDTLGLCQIGLPITLSPIVLPMLALTFKPSCCPILNWRYLCSLQSSSMTFKYGHT